MSGGQIFSNNILELDHRNANSVNWCHRGQFLSHTLTSSISKQKGLNVNINKYTIMYYIINLVFACNFSLVKWKKAFFLLRFNKRNIDFPLSFTIAQNKGNQTQSTHGMRVLRAILKRGMNSNKLKTCQIRNLNKKYLRYFQTNKQSNDDN
jgi:hypothetical protein